MTETQVFLSLGANLGDRLQSVRHALTALRLEGISITRESSIYETEPQEIAQQPWFLNMAVECRTKLFPLQLLAALRRIEKTLGRDRTEAAIPKGPRLIDIDILLYGHAIIEAPELVVPHPRMMERRFVLAPLAEIAPALRHPVSGIFLRDQLDKIQGQLVRRFETSAEGRG
jgi:2-amino-4-hydroxy-6-hydroxymethyldihydropteridine diphosphokinase